MDIDMAGSMNEQPSSTIRNSCIVANPNKIETFAASSDAEGSCNYTNISNIQLSPQLKFTQEEHARCLMFMDVRDALFRTGDWSVVTNPELILIDIKGV